MGWFDNEQDELKPTPAAPQAAPPRPQAKVASAPAPESGSTLGRQIHIDGTIVCDEDLTILGRVDGTIRAKGTLVIAKEADVHAKIDGQRVLVHGKVNGNVHGAERVVLGQTAKLTGNIDAPTLEITEGAYFKGNVEMKPPKPAKEAPKQVADKGRPAESKASGSGEEERPAAAGDEATPVKAVGGPTLDESAAARGQATP